MCAKYLFWHSWGSQYDIVYVEFHTVGMQYLEEKQSKTDLTAIPSYESRSRGKHNILGEKLSMKGSHAGTPTNQY